MTQALKRLQDELDKFNKEEQEGLSAGPINEYTLFIWKASLTCPEDSPFEGGTFKFELTFPKDYPFKPPKLEIQTKIYHPNVNNGTNSINLGILEDHWNP